MPDIQEIDVNNFKLNIGDKIRTYRKQDKSIKVQEKLAEKSDISVDFLSKIELGNSTPSSLYLVKICNALNITPNEILYDFIRNKDLSINNILISQINKLSFKRKELILKIIEEIIQLDY